MITMESSTKPHLFREVIDRLRTEGATAKIPSLQQLLPGWKVSFNPHHKEILEEYEKWCRRWFGDHMCSELTKAECPKFIALGFPDAPKDKLLGIVKWIACNLPFDDAIDIGKLCAEEQTKLYNDEVAICKLSLESKVPVQVEEHPDPIIQSFWDMAMTIRSDVDLEWNRELAGYFLRYLETCAVTTPLGRPRTVVEYLEFRVENIGVYSLLALIQYACPDSVPPRSLNCESKRAEMIKKLWKNVAVSVLLANDIYSLRREVLDGGFDNIVTLLMHQESMSLQAAIDHTVQLLHDGYTEFKMYEKELIDDVEAEIKMLGGEHGGSLCTKETMQGYIDSLKNVIMANGHWSATLPRYLDGSILQEDRSIELHITVPKELL